MAQKVFVLIDCNNFFASCEQLFRPNLMHTPIVVLSSNDGCVIARSNEAKALGIPMGAPAFKYQHIFNQHHVEQFSASFELYGNISRRITNILSAITPNIEVYSIDESFLDISALEIANYRRWALQLRARILQEIGIPVSVGIAPSKTLAKLASDIAKKQPAYQGAFSFTAISENARQQVLATVPITAIWGIGWRLGPKLQAKGIYTTLQLSKMTPRYAGQLLSIRGRQLVAELNGISCLPLEVSHKKQQSIMRGRTFGHDTNNQHVIASIIANMAARATHRLREESQATLRAGFFIETSRHKPGYRRWHKEVVFETPTNDTGAIIASLTKAFTEIHERGQLYHQLNVYLSHLVPDHYLQLDTFGTVHTDQHTRAQRRMQAIDTINNRFGRGHLYYATEDLDTSWQPRRKLTTPRYVSSWHELPIARILTKS